MKKILLATTVLVGTAGFAAAEVSISGSARMGVVNAFDTDTVDNQTRFSSRIRVNFDMSGETDGGLSFGASIRADQAGTGNSGATAMDAGSVFVSGAFGKISMGDNDSAANALIGQTNGVGYTGNGDFNEIAYIGMTDTSVLYTYSAGDLTVGASIGQVDAEVDQNGDPAQAYSVAASYKIGDYKVMAGYEKGQAVINSYDNEADFAAGTTEDEFRLRNHYVLGADATFGAVTVKARVGKANGQNDATNDEADATQYSLSGTYTMDALSLTAFAAKFDADDGTYGYEATRYGVGVAYDLGGGATALAGYSTQNNSLPGNGVDDWSLNRYEAGLTFSF